VEENSDAAGGGGEVTELRLVGLDGTTWTQHNSA